MALTVLPQPQEAPDVPRVVRMVLRLRGKRSADVAAVLHLSEAAVSKRLTGQIDFRAGELIALGRYLDVEPGVFFTAPEDLVRSRCFSQVVPPPGQMQLALGVERPALRAM